jgi:hypothetical protein
MDHEIEARSIGGIAVSSAGVAALNVPKIYVRTNASAAHFAC